MLEKDEFDDGFELNDYSFFSFFVFLVPLLHRFGRKKTAKPYFEG